MTGLKRSDVTELVIGASILAFPVATTGEIWDLSEQIPLINVLAIAFVSCIFLSLFIYHIHQKNDANFLHRLDIKRLLVTYGITLLVCAAILLMLGKLPLFTDTSVALKRVVLVAFPASFSATVVDSLQ